MIPSMLSGVTLEQCKAIIEHRTFEVDGHMARYLVDNGDAIDPNKPMSYLTILI